MIETKIRGSVALLMLGGALALSGCGAQAVDSSEEIASLTKQLKEEQRVTKALMDRLERVERRMDGHSQDLDRLGRQTVETELAVSAVAEVQEDDGEAMASLPAAGLDVASLLSTEDGRAAVESAMTAIQEKRDTERRSRWVDSMVDRFAADANLTETQSVDMRRIVGESFKQIGELWAGMRSGGSSPEERAIQREEIMVKMAEIQESTSEEVKTILSADQFAIYEEQTARMRGWGGGRGRSRSR